jgi:hypothetical protein
MAEPGFVDSVVNPSSMEDTAGFFKATINWNGNKAIIGIGGDSKPEWWLVKHTGWWISNPGCNKGAWSKSMRYTWSEQGDFTHCLSGDGSGVLFRLKDVTFPPDPENNASFYYKGFFFGDAWLAADPSKGGIRTNSSWQPIITDMLLRATIAKFEQIQKEIIQMGIQAGLDTTSILDPTGVLSAAGAAYAMRRGDYVGCAMSLLGIIPVVGKACELAKVAQASGKLARLTQRLKNLMEAIKSSSKVTQEMRLEGAVIREELQGSTDLAAATRAASGASTKLVTAGAELAKEAEKGGMSVQDAKNMQEFTARNNAVGCVRYTAKESQARLGDVLNDGKPCELAAYHTAHGDSIYSGYIVVNKAQVESLCFKDGQGVTRLKGLSPEYKVMDHACPRTGDRLITRNGTAYYSDYDFMGMYHAANGNPYLDFKELNDNPGIVAFMQRMFPAYGNKVQHGMQDFFIKADGTMGRQPKIDETFLFFEPNGKVSYVDLIDLRRLYAKYHIKWPYEVFNKTERIRVLTNTTQAVVSAGRASQTR